MAETIDVVDRAKVALDAAGYAPVRLRPLVDGEKGMCIRRVPSTPTEVYMDGTHEIGYLFEVHVRAESELQAIEDAESAGHVLCTADMRSANGSYQLVSCAVYSPVSETSREEGSHIYTVGIRADIITAI